MPSIERTLHQVNLQTAWIHLIAFDNGSTDGTRTLLEKSAEDVIDISESGYRPGRLLNEGMRRAKSDIVVFLNSDCVPTDERWLERLLDPFSDPKVAATYGRLFRRPGFSSADPQSHEIEDAQVNSFRPRRWKNCFSTANAALRRSVWQELPFDESVHVSEDIAWGWRVHNAGYSIRYAPAAAVCHSPAEKQNYGKQQPLKLVRTDRSKLMTSAGPRPGTPVL